MEEDIQNVGTEATQKPQVSAKTYTQDEVNKIVADRLAREKKKPTQKTVSDSSWKKEKAQMMSQMAKYEKQLVQSKYRIKPDYLDYVDYKVSHNTNNETSYEQAMKLFFDGEGKNYLESDEPQTIKQPRPKNSNTMENSVANDNLRRWAGLK